MGVAIDVSVETDLVVAVGVATDMVSKYSSVWVRSGHVNNKCASGEDK